MSTLVDAHDLSAPSGHPRVWPPAQTLATHAWGGIASSTHEHRLPLLDKCPHRLLVILGARNLHPGPLDGLPSASFAATSLVGGNSCSSRPCEPPRFPADNQANHRKDGEHH